MKIIEAKSEKEIKQYYNLRYAILRKPWNQPRQSTKDKWEDQSIHVLKIDENEEAIACGRLQLNSKEEGQIRSLSVKTQLQGNGLGKQIINRIEVKARE